jgi:predicted amidohydrolase YtcJ
LLAPEDIPRFAQLGVACSVQFSHAPSDRDLAERYWSSKLGGAYAFRSLLDSGAVLANGSDAPIEELDPLAGVRAGVRRTIDARPPWRGEEAVTIEEAFRATCVTPAWLAHDETRRGSLKPGRYADLVVLDRDPWDDLDAEVVATMVGGRWVHNPPPWG